MTTEQQATKRLNALKAQFAGCMDLQASLDKEMKGAIKDLPTTPELAYFKNLPDSIAQRMEKARKTGQGEEQGMRIITELKEQLKKNKGAD